MRNKKEKIVRSDSGITLIALVITIIILLILAGITITSLTGKKGLITNVRQAESDHAHAEVREAIVLALNEYHMQVETSKNVRTLKKLGTINKEIKSGISDTDSITSPTTSVTTFRSFLLDKGYITETNHINTEKLVGKQTKFGNGSDQKDEYVFELKFEKEAGIIVGGNITTGTITGYKVNYYDKNSNLVNIWDYSEDVES